MGAHQATCASLRIQNEAKANSVGFSDLNHFRCFTRRKPTPRPFGRGSCWTNWPNTFKTQHGGRSFAACSLFEIVLHILHLSMLPSTSSWLLVMRLTSSSEKYAAKSGLGTARQEVNQGGHQEEATKSTDYRVTVKQFSSLYSWKCAWPGSAKHDDPVHLITGCRCLSKASLPVPGCSGGI